MKFFKAAIVLTLFFSLLTGFIVKGNHVEAASTQTAIVNTDTNLNVRSGPGTKYKVIGSLKKKTKITVYSKTKSGWSEIRYKGKKGYVATKYLKFIVSVKVSQKKYKNISALKYPQVSRLKSKSAEKKINQTLENYAKNSYKAYLQTEKDEKEHRKEGWCSGSMCNYTYSTSYQVKFNQDGKLSILMTSYYYGGGAHGMGEVTSFNFTTSNGNQQKISNILTSKSKYTKVQKYAYNYMKNREPFKGMIEKQSDVPVNKNSQFYYTSGGIYLVFQEYEVAAYAAGNPTVKIPSSVYK